ncbi:hypothetical protein COCON_G00087230 [Conger conger]|uniref:Uncharacterized protein n=1 Tax=Conger conger TaxID=82655 RepID=A0A9Q1DKC6_CONCO|nr:hypothetical protein COCON_G00087230 [Conger conger]
MNPQQERMAPVGTDKELSDLLDFSAGVRAGGARGLAWFPGVSQARLAPVAACLRVPSCGRTRLTCWRSARIAFLPRQPD